MAQQYSLKVGLKRFGERGEHSVTVDLYQIHETETFAPFDDNKRTKKDRREVLSSLMLLTEKGIEKLKGEHLPMVEKIW